jgi:phosphatidylglycerophosphatase A
MNAQTVCKQIATLGAIGYTKTPGTLATVITLPLVYILSKAAHLSSASEVFLCTIFIATAYVIIKTALPLFYNKQDPSEIVLDEVVGCFTTFCALPLTPMTIIIGFILFRFFDIVKPFFIKECENLPGAFGIIADDIAAGLIAHGFLRFIMLFIS